MSKPVKTFSADNYTFANTIVQQLDVLSVRRKEWEATHYKKSNDGLYELIGGCVGVFTERFVKGTEADQKALRISLIQRLQADGIRIVKSSTTLTMLARFVFNSDRKRAQGYSYVIAAAVSQGIQVADFAEWIVKQGGIEEVKRIMVKSEKSKIKQIAIEAATAVVKGSLELNALQPLAHVGIAGLSGNYAVLLVKPDVNGGADIVGSLSDINDSLVNALILRMAKEQVAKDEADKALGTQISKEQTDMLATKDEQQRKVVNG